MPVGSSITVTGSGFDPGSAVVLLFGPRPAGTTTAGGDGGFSRSLIVPADAAPGRYELRATGFAGSGVPYEQAASVEVVAASGSGPVSRVAVDGGLALPGARGSVVAADAPHGGQVLGGATVGGSRSSDGGWRLLAAAAGGVVLVAGGAGAFVAGRRRQANELTPPMTFH